MRSTLGLPQLTNDMSVSGMGRSPYDLACTPLLVSGDLKDSVSSTDLLGGSACGFSGNAADQRQRYMCFYWSWHRIGLILNLAVQRRDRWCWSRRRPCRLNFHLRDDINATEIRCPLQHAIRSNGREGTILWSEDRCSCWPTSSHSNQQSD